MFVFKNFHFYGWKCWSISDAKKIKWSLFTSFFNFPRSLNYCWYYKNDLLKSSTIPSKKRTRNNLFMDKKKCFYFSHIFIIRYRNLRKTDVTLAKTLFWVFHVMLNKTLEKGLLNDHIISKISLEHYNTLSGISNLTLPIREAICII